MATKLLTPLGGGVTLEAANTATDKTLTLPADNGTVVYANSSGNVGIGTSSPSDKLVVTGNILGGKDGTNGFASLQQGTPTITGFVGFFDAASTRRGYIGYVDAGTNGLNIATDSTYPIRFVTNSAEQARITSAGLLQFNSGYGSVAAAYGCRAWVNFNGTGTVAINASGNVSSITDNGTGSYTVNFTTSMPDANYSIAGTARSNDGSTGRGRLEPHPTTTPTTSGVRVVTNSIQNVSAERDSPSVYVQIFR